MNDTEYLISLNGTTARNYAEGSGWKAMASGVRWQKADGTHVVYMDKPEKLEGLEGYTVHLCPTYQRHPDREEFETLMYSAKARRAQPMVAVEA